MASEKETFEALRYHITMGKYGEKQYRNADGQLHRVGGPAVVWGSGEQEWYQNNQRHREDGPAVDAANGYKEWHLHGKLHRTDGPAVIHEDGAKEWWIHGVQYTERAYRTQLKAQGYTA